MITQEHPFPPLKLSFMKFSSIFKFSSLNIHHGNFSNYPSHSFSSYKISDCSSVLVKLSLKVVWYSVAPTASESMMRLILCHKPLHKHSSHVKKKKQQKNPITYTEDMHLIPVNYFGLLFWIIYDGWLSIITSQTLYNLCHPNLQHPQLQGWRRMDSNKGNVTGGSKAPVQQGYLCSLLSDH